MTYAGRGTGVGGYACGGKKDGFVVGSGEAKVVCRAVLIGVPDFACVVMGGGNIGLVDGGSLVYVVKWVCMGPYNH